MEGNQKSAIFKLPKSARLILYYILTFLREEIAQMNKQNVKLKTRM